MMGVLRVFKNGQLWQETHIWGSPALNSFHVAQSKYGSWLPIGGWSQYKCFTAHGAAITGKLLFSRKSRTSLEDLTVHRWVGGLWFCLVGLGPGFRKLVT